ncbi:cysteinyl leukotriene receptor 1-like [Rhinatrema bivittatum]|uniref:cysteinyl leukotriene receptor 1-like n=1 Tax=Rhinatrema bivittatum TaxID=194408 RepID=UPI0011284D78|nr:cysteinyl leukotriene receptor 1-like [Rhinatrema bivittatum]XP_029462388.1 cysteinyl leukotriene receptor 1-like [Rhinatrema bivittatum]
MPLSGNTTQLGNYTNLSCPNIDEFRNQVYSTAYSLFTFFGFFGNSFALYVLIRTYSQKTAFHIYMLNLAVSDLLFICTLPLRVVYYVNKGKWFFGDFMCRISSYAFYVNLYCSIFILTAMSFFRFVAIVFPVQNLKLVNVKNARLVCIGIWIFVTLANIPFLITGSSVKGNKTKCFEPPSSVKSLIIMNYISLIFGFTIPFIIILVCYTMIIKTLLNNVMNRQQANRKKAVRMIIIVMAVFFISFMPYHIQRTVHLHFLHRQETCEETIHMQKLVVITLALAASNCCFDPLLYFFSGENFRRRLSTLRKPSLTSIPQSSKRKKSLIAQEKSDLFQEDQNKQDSSES